MPTDAERAALAWTYLTKTTDSYPTWRRKGFPNTNWAKAKAELDAIVGGVVPPPPAPPPPPTGTPIPSDGIIRAAGVYAGPFGGQIRISPGLGAVTLTGGPFTYKNGTMIVTPSSGVDLTLDHATIDGGTYRLIDCDLFKRIQLLNCTIEKTAGVTCVGSGEVRILRTRHHNIQRNPGSVGNLIQFRIFQSGVAEVGWNEVVNEYGKSDPEDIISIYHSSNVHVHDNMLWGQFHPGNGSGSSQNGITLDGYGGSGQPVDNNIIEDNQVVRALSIAVFPTSTGPARGTRFLRNRVVNAGLLDDGVTRNYYGYQGMSVKPGGSDNQAHGNVLGTMNGTSQGSGRGRDGEFSGEPRGNGNGVDTGAWADNTHLKPGQTITQADENAEWDRWVAKKAAAGVVVGA